MASVPLHEAGKTKIRGHAKNNLEEGNRFAQTIPFQSQRHTPDFYFFQAYSEVASPPTPPSPNTLWNHPLRFSDDLLHPSLPANPDLTPVSGIFSHPAHILCKEVDKMERRDRKSQILNILAKNVRRVIEKDAADIDGLQEIRLRIGQPLRVLRGTEKLSCRKTDSRISLPRKR